MNGGHLPRYDQVEYVSLFKYRKNLTVCLEKIDEATKYDTGG
jgi:hypothetical protein